MSQILVLLKAHGTLLLRILRFPPKRWLIDGRPSRTGLISSTAKRFIMTQWKLQLGAGVLNKKVHTLSTPWTWINPDSLPLEKQTPMLGKIGSYSFYKGKIWGLVLEGPGEGCSSPIQVYGIQRKYLVFG